MSEWQPIETAPKEDTEILAIDSEGRHFITAYRPDCCAGSGFGVIHSCCGFYQDANPTHWMPLPDAPQTTPSTHD